MHAAVPESPRLREATDAVRRAAPRVPRVAIVLGSGLGGLGDAISDATSIRYDDIPHMPRSHVEGHAGRLVVGTLEGVPVVAMQGRVHLYEGWEPNDVVFGARLMLRLGADTLIVTNAAGGLDPSFSVGDLMVIADHLNLTSRSPLVGPNEEELGPRFVDMTVAYDLPLREQAMRVAAERGDTLRSGVYAGLLGPTYETPAEIRMLRTLGASAVGMSTVLEVAAARHLGARVLGISCITNLAAGLGPGVLSHDEVKATADLAASRLERLVRGVVRGLS